MFLNDDEAAEAIGGGGRQAQQDRDQQWRHFGLASVSTDQIAQSAEDRTLIDVLTACARRRRKDAIRQTAERQRLQPYPSRAAERGEEQSFAAEQHILEAADELNV